jgi:hypothetical protein
VSSLPGRGSPPARRSALGGPGTSARVGVLPVRVELRLHEAPQSVGPSRRISSIVSARPARRSGESGSGRDPTSSSPRTELGRTVASARRNNRPSTRRRHACPVDLAGDRLGPRVIVARRPYSRGAATSCCARAVSCGSHMRSSSGKRVQQQDVHNAATTSSSAAIADALTAVEPTRRARRTYRARRSIRSRARRIHGT